MPVPPFVGSFYGVRWSMISTTCVDLAGLKNVAKLKDRYKKQLQRMGKRSYRYIVHREGRF